MPTCKSLQDNKYTKNGMLREFAINLSHSNPRKQADRIWFWSEGIKQTKESINLLSEPRAKRTPLWKIGRLTLAPIMLGGVMLNPASLPKYVLSLY